MKITRVVMCSVAALALSVSAALAQIPNITAALGNTCTGIEITAAQTNGTFTYTTSVAPGATFNGFTVLAVRDIVIYPNAGNDATGPTSIVAIAPNWSVTPPGYSEANDGFGYGVDNQPLVNGVLPGQTTVIGSATFSVLPPNPVYVAHAIYQTANGEGSGFCVVNGEVPPPVIPEPGTLSLLAMGAAPLAGIIRRRRA